MFRLSAILCSKVQFSTGNVKNLIKDTQLIDFIKILIKDFDSSILEANTLLLFEQRNISNEGFLFPILDKNKEHAKDRKGNLLYKKPYKNAFYKGLEFKIYESGLITISGSLHIYWNNGAHNFNDFDNNAIEWVLQDLKTKFNINPKQCILKCLEIGINITPPVPTNEILDNCFLHKTKPFEYQKNSDEGKYKQVQHSQYIIKIYNKTLHYKSKGFKIDGEIMRFEIKYIKMEKLNQKEIYSLQDLINYGLHNLKYNLLSEWQNVLFFDKSTRIDHLNTKLKNRVLKYSNPNYWTGLLSNNQTENFKKHKRQLNNIISKYSENIQNQIAEIMIKKIDLLNIKSTQIDPLTILSNQGVLNNLNNNICKVTGVNISMQKSNSILLSHTGLKYYYNTDRKIFEQLKRRYLSKQWFNSDFQKQIKEIAHNIRNTKSNQTIKQKRIYNPSQLNILHSLGFRTNPRV